MRIFKRLITMLLAITLLSLTFVACHAKRKMEPFVMPEEFDTSREYEISFWAKNDTNMTQVGIYQKAIKDFEAIYPNVKVKLELYTNYADIYKDVINNVMTGTTPNVCITYPDHIATYMMGDNVVVPLDELLVDQKYGLGGDRIEFDSPALSEMVPEFMEECKIGKPITQFLICAQQRRAISIRPSSKSLDIPFPTC